MKYKDIIALLLISMPLAATAQVELRTEAQFTGSTGDNTPLWLNANKHGLSSLKKANGYVRAGLFRDIEADSARRWALGFGADAAVAAGFTSTLVVQQAYGEARWLKGLLTVGSKEQPLELKNQELSTGSQTLGINARPLPGVRLSLPDYWNIPGTRGLLAIKGHVSYGIMTDNNWQKDVTKPGIRYTEDVMVHTKAGYLRIGKPQKPLTVELGLEMACQFGGTIYGPNFPGGVLKNESGLKSMVNALLFKGSEANETEYKNTEGNHMGSLLARVTYDQPTWSIAAYADHFFEDHSQLFFNCFDGYGTGDDWNRHVSDRHFLYDLRDMMLGVELQLKDCRWVDHIVAEYMYTKYQSGPVYHDHTQQMPDQMAGRDEYYNHYIYPGWQHWGQVMGNPLYRSPIYNTDGWVWIENNRFWAWHVAASGNPIERLHYRLMCTWQRGFGTYDRPLMDPQDNLSLMAEAAYAFAPDGPLRGWTVKGAVGLDHGRLLGDNLGLQVTVAKRMDILKQKHKQ